MSHVYVGIEDIGLTAPQRQTLIDGLKQLGPRFDPQPARRCHWRIRLDGLAAIYEAAFDAGDVRIDGIKTRLGTIFGVDPATISHAVTSTAYGPLVTFNRGGDRLRLIQFGGVSPTWMQSGDACRAYLAANAAAWEEPIG